MADGAYRWQGNAPAPDAARVAEIDAAWDETKADAFAEPARAAAIFDATDTAVDVPVPLKMRMGWDPGSRNAPELAAEDVRLAARALGRVTGRIDPEDVLDQVFSKFCIGK